MTDENDVEKKRNFVLEKVSSQKGDGLNMKAGDGGALASPARRKVKVKVKRSSTQEKKYVEAPPAQKSIVIDEKTKPRVTVLSQKKEKFEKEELIKEDTKSENKNDMSILPAKKAIPIDSLNSEAEKEALPDSSLNVPVNSILESSPMNMEESKKKEVDKKEEEQAKRKSANIQSGKNEFSELPTKKGEMPTKKDEKNIEGVKKDNKVEDNKLNKKSGVSPEKKEEISSCIIRDPGTPPMLDGMQQRRYGSIDDINKRPNIKAGNLSDNAKKYRYNKKGQDAKTGDRQKSGQFGDKRRDWSGGQRGQDGKRSSGSDNKGNKGGSQGTKKTFSFGMPRSMVAPIPVEVQKQNKKTRVVKKDYSRKSKEEEFFEEKQIQQKKKVRDRVSAVPQEIQILETISVADLAKKMNLRASEIIAKLMENGMMVTVNQSIDSDTVQIIASDYDCNVKVVSLYDETIIESANDEGVELKPRPPIVTVMGHVDHGKTKTLDAIRSSNVAGGEFGGITQHIGAYTVSYNDKLITFLDTPGHEAFTMMRARGASITDIVVLVVAADDGVMPQTVEAINHAKDAKVPIIVAINKMDKQEANPDKIKTRLSEMDLMPEDWGGKTMYVEISALKKQGISDLLEAILLQAEVLELKANYECLAEGKVIESKIDHGRGVVASIIVQKGILREGDPYVAGIYSGHVRAIFNDKGSRIVEALPSMPCEILGLDEMPNAGDPFQVLESEKQARQISNKRRELKRFEVAKAVKKVTLDNLYDTIQEGAILELKVIIKADVQGSVEALTQSLEKLSTSEIRLSVIHASAGAINESDVMLATADSNVIIIGFNVRPTLKARLLAEAEKVDIRRYTVIYQAVEEMKMAMEGMLSPDKKEVLVGNAEVRNVFKVSKVGNVAGVYVLDGNIKRSYLVNVVRDNLVLAHSLKIASLKRFKDDVKEVSQGFECGLSLEGFNDIMEGDSLEFIEIQEVSRKLDSKMSEAEKGSE